MYTLPPDRMIVGQYDRPSVCRRVFAMIKHLRVWYASTTHVRYRPLIKSRHTETIREVCNLHLYKRYVTHIPIRGLEPTSLQNERDMWGSGGEW